MEPSSPTRIPTRIAIACIGTWGRRSCFHAALAVAIAPTNAATSIASAHVAMSGDVRIREAETHRSTR